LLLAAHLARGFNLPVPRKGKKWRHVIISTRRSWFHGDDRGFRSREHRVHSSGDYKSPPPEGEHEGLRKYHEKRAKGKAVKIPFALRGEVGLALLRAVTEDGYRVLTIAVSQKHAHLLVELPRDRATVKRIVGRWKSARTPAVRKWRKGSIWGEGGKYKLVRTVAHQVEAYDYIRRKQGPRAWVWYFKQGTPLGAKPRKGRGRGSA
jgi:REP element-mobilizing transposase RayT